MHYVKYDFLELSISASSLVPHNKTNIPKKSRIKVGASIQTADIIVYAPNV